MEKTSLQLARFVLGLSWIYHGLFPKLLTVAPSEAAMTAMFGFSDGISFWITKLAGIIEIIFGVLLIVYYKNTWLQLSNIIALLLLLAFVAFTLPYFLIDAFNPVTTNIALIALSYILIVNTRNQNS